ncbi:MAG: biotin--[acetyl-CoA-carboxylase] ligase [Pseudomonadota bacterium]
MDICQPFPAEKRFTIDIMTTRDKLLAYLQANPDCWISGEILSRILKVSRAAINKHIKKLRQDGYQIESSTKKGYRIGEYHDLISADEIRDHLTTTIFGRQKIFILKETDSTNLQARKPAAEGEPEGTIVIAESQHSGRGRKGREWFSPSNAGIYASIILRPRISPAEAPGITLMTAVAVVESLISIYEIPIRIKWPNDLLIGDRKIAGILTEISTEMDRVDYIIVGIGLNVNTAVHDFPAALQEKATSLYAATGKRFSRVTVLKTILQEFEAYYDLFRREGFSGIRDRWISHSDIIGRDVMIRKIGGELRGRIIDIDHEGVLILQDHLEKVHRIFSGDLVL